MGGKIEDQLVIHFHPTPYPLSKDKYLYAITLDKYFSMSIQKKKEFSHKYGSYVSMIHLRYGEVIGVEEDIRFLPSDVLSNEIVEDLLSLAVSTHY